MTHHDEEPEMEMMRRLRGMTPHDKAVPDSKDCSVCGSVATVERWVLSAQDPRYDFFCAKHDPEVNRV